MSVSQNDYRGWSMISTESMDTKTAGTGHLYKAVDHGGGIAANGRESIGILYSTGQSSEHIGLATDGKLKYTAGATVNTGVELTVTTSGYFIAAASGDTVVGRNLDTAAVSGGIMVGHFDFANRYNFDISSYVRSSFEYFTFSVKANLTAGVGKAVNVDLGDVAATVNLAEGILVANTASGGTGMLFSVGRCQVNAGGVITKQRSLTLTTGGVFLDANSGDVTCGVALEASAAGNSGGLFDAIINFATPHYATSCLDIHYGV